MNNKLFLSHHLSCFFKALFYMSLLIAEKMSNVMIEQFNIYINTKCASKRVRISSLCTEGRQICIQCHKQLIRTHFDKHCILVYLLCSIVDTTFIVKTVDLLCHYSIRQICIYCHNQLTRTLFDTHCIILLYLYLLCSIVSIIVKT